MSKILNAKPVFNYMFLTCNETKTTESGIILGVGDSIINDTQIVLACGDSVRTFKKGDTVKIDVRQYVRKKWDDEKSITGAVMKETGVVVWPIEEIDGLDVMVVPDNHIRYFWPARQLN
jgi:hypothetical protein